MGAVVYAETFGNASQVWLYRQVRELGVPVLTHERLDPATFPYDRVLVVPWNRTATDLARAAWRRLRDRHGRRLPASMEARMARRLADLGATLVHAHFGTAALSVLPVARALALPLVATFHGFDMSSLPATDPSYRKALPRLFHAAHRIVAVSRVTRERLVALGCPPDRIVELPLGVPVAPPPPPRAAGPVVRVLTVARLHPKKGVPDLVDAVARARALGAPLELDIAGDGPERAEVLRRIEAGGLRGTVRVHGALPPAEVQRLLGAADIFVLNSRTAPDGDIEALGISLLEAMERGVCAIGASHGGIPEVLEDGVTGLLVPERDTAALAHALARVAGDAGLRARLAAAGRALVERYFDLAACTARLAALYREADL